MSLDASLGLLPALFPAFRLEKGYDKGPVLRTCAISTFIACCPSPTIFSLPRRRWKSNSHDSSIVYVPWANCSPSRRDHAPFSFHHHTHYLRIQAIFAFSTDGHGLPLALHFVESRAGESLSIAPHCVPPVRRVQYRAPLLALVLERSPAGEETHLLLFCAALVAIVIWGCVRL